MTQQAMLNPETIRERIQQLASPEHGGRKWYQYVDFGNGVTTEPYSLGRCRYRTETFLDFLSGFDLRADDRVLDLGSNAGLLSLVCGERCADVTGVEIDKGFAEQAEFVKNFWESQGKDVGNVRLYCTDIIQNLDLVADRTVILASKVLYHKHLGDGLYKLMESIEQAPVRCILLQGHTVQGEVGQDDGMNKLMNRYGFHYELVKPDDEYPIALATR